jgi:hypothetical protein
MNTSQQATVLIVSGLRVHVEDHWQTHRRRNLSSIRTIDSVPPLEADKPTCAARVLAVQRTIETIEGPVIGTERVDVGAGHINPRRRASACGRWPNSSSNAWSPDAHPVQRIRT